MEQNAKSSDLQKIQLLGERAVLHAKLAGRCFYAFVAVFALFIYKVSGDTGVRTAECLFGIFIIGCLAAFTGFGVYSERELRRTAVLVLENVWRFHHDRLMQLILIWANNKSEKRLSFQDLDESVITEMLKTDSKTALSVAAALLLKKVEAGSAGRPLDIDVLRTFYGQLLRYKIPFLPHWSQARRKLLAEYLSNQRYREETFSARNRILKSFLSKTAASVVIAAVCVPLFQIYRLLPSRDKVALYELERGLGFRRRAVDWLRMAAVDGDSDTRRRLAEIYLTGQDVEKDYYEAAFWFWKSMNIESMQALSDMHQKGTGVRKDENTSAFWQYQANKDKRITLTSKEEMNIDLKIRKSTKWGAKVLAAYSTAKNKKEALDEARRIEADLQIREKILAETKKIVDARKGRYYNDQDLDVWERFATAPCSVDPKFQEIRPYLAEGMCVNAIDKDGNTALINAVMCNRPDTVKLLIENGIDKEILNYDGLTALSLAVRLSRRDLVKLLVESGADVNRAGRQGMTPLHWSIQSGDPEISRFLLSHGADPKARTKTGLNALQMAKKLKRKVIETMLREAGATE